MKYQQKFRKVNKREKEIIYNSVQKISQRIIPFLNELNHEFYISFQDSRIKRVYPSIFLAPHDLSKNFNFDKSKINFISIGLYFGFMKKNQLYLSLEAADLLHENNVLRESNYLLVNHKGEKAILYGNNIIKNHLVKITKSLKKNEFLLILNQEEELISIALSVINGDSIGNLGPKTVIAKTLNDKGSYLRVEQ